MSFLAKSKGEVTYKDLSGVHKWFLIVLVSMGSSIIYTPIYLKNVFYEPLMQGLGCTNADLGALLSCYAITALITYLPAGILADKVRMRTLSWVGFGGTAVLTFIYAMLPSLGMLYALFVGFGITSILIWWGTRFKIVRLCCAEDEYASKIGTSYSIYGAAGLIIGLICTAIVSMIPIPSQGIQVLLVFLGVLIAILAVLSFIFIPDFKGEINKNAKMFSLGEVVQAIKHPGVIWACLAYFFVYAVYQGVTYTTPFMTAAFAAPVAIVSVVGLIRTYGIGLIAGPAAGILADKVFKSPSKSILVFFGAAVIVLAAFLVLPRDAGMVVAVAALVVVLGFVTYGAFSIGSSPLTEAKVPMGIFGTASGILSVVGFMPDVFVHTWFGGMIDAQGNDAFNSIFLVLIVFAVLGCACLVMTRRAMKKNAAVETAE
ncbi:MAG: MFS transporter [Gordonibacter sp.]|nr:MFS transporter [Gordonibacter sp.]